MGGRRRIRRYRRPSHRRRPDRHRRLEVDLPAERPDRAPRHLPSPDPARGESSLRAGEGIRPRRRGNRDGGDPLLVYTLVNADNAGWSSARTVGLFASSALLLGVFVLVESRAWPPLVPFGIFRFEALFGSNVASLLFGGGMFGMFFVVTLYLQQVLGYSPLRAGLAWLALSVPALLGSVAGSLAVTRVGPRLPIIAGMAMLGGGTWLLSGISADGGYLTDLMPALIVSGLGLGTAFVTMSIGALEGVEDQPFRPRLRPDQHDPASRRRTRCRRPLIDRHLDNQRRSCRQPRDAGLGRPHRGLPDSSARERRVRSRRRTRRAPSDPQAHNRSASTGSSNAPVGRIGDTMIQGRERQSSATAAPSRRSRPFRRKRAASRTRRPTTCTVKRP